MRSSSQFDLFRVLLTRKDATELLLECSPNGVRLPALTISAHTRPAKELTEAIEKRLNLKTYCLFTLPAEDASNSSASAAVLEAGPLSERLPHGMEWNPVASLAHAHFDDSSSYAVIESALGILDQHRRGQLRGSFGQTGWLRFVTEWVEAEASGIGLCLTGDYRQWNASPTFSLIRFETNGPALWFKAVGQPNLHEYSITRKLATAFPEFLPRLLALQPGWNAWLSVEAEGAHLTKDSSLSDWCRIVSTFARLQLATFGNALHLIDAGCKDVRAHTLQSHVGPFFDFIAELMEQQVKPTPAPLSAQQIRTLACDVETSLERLAACGIPNVLGHMDLNPENILVGDTRCAFLDWAEGAVGHPFSSFEYLREHWRKLQGRDAAAEKALVSVYTREWRSFASQPDIDGALEHTPLVSAFASVALSMPWQGPESRRQAIAPYLRSLSRRMKREADALNERRALCVP
jgi:hypothetical protein